MKIIRSNNKLIYQKGIFLAGPTYRSDKPSWREKAIEIFKKYNYNDYLFIPEPFTGIYKTQIEWELFYLEQSKLIMFWVPRELKELPGFTTNVEFGMYFKSNKVIYGRPDNADKIRYLDYIYNKYNDNKIQNTLEATIKLTLENYDN